MTEPGASSRSIEIKKFIASFSTAKGALSTVVITLSLSFALGCTVAIVPEILSDRYARLHHGYDWTLPCSSFDDETMPIACRRGSDDAQDASAWSSLLQNLLTLFFNPVVGKMSDIHGRRRIFILAIFTYTLAPLSLVAMELYPTMQPIYYYLASCLIGIISYSSISFAIISDSVPEEFRTASFGIIMAGFYSGFCLSPLLALVLTHTHVSILSFTLTFAALVYASIYFPETLPTTVREANQQLLTNQENETIVASFPAQIGALLTRPFREMSILNRDLAIRLVAIGSFFSSMVYSTDANLVIFYIEEYLDVREEDIAYQFLLMGVVGVVMQGCLLQPLLKCFGDKGLLIISFLSGTTHNLLYGVAKNKQTLYVALSLSQLTKINAPILASLASKDASANEQGQLQGALYAVNALSAAIGPLSMQSIYERTKDTRCGPGTMFVFASFLYFIGTLVVSFIPVGSEGGDRASAASSPNISSMENNCNDLEEPLLANFEEANTPPTT